VFVSSDRTEAEHDAYFAKMPWLALPYGNRARKEELAQRCKVKGIPSLCVYDAATGKLVTTKGVEGVYREQDKCPWAHLGTQ
jgi:nucleoredoxin